MCSIYNISYPAVADVAVARKINVTHSKNSSGTFVGDFRTDDGGACGLEAKTLMSLFLSKRI